MIRLWFLFLILVSSPVFADTDEMNDRECREIAGEQLAADEILFAYSMEGKLDALAIFDGSDFLPVDGKEFKHITEMYSLRDQKRHTVLFDAYFTKLGEDRCIWFAKLKKSKSHAISIFANKSVDLAHKFDRKTADLFDSLKTACTDQGEYPFDIKVPCTQWKLLATSDLNSNGQTEFWFSVPYTWDTGFAIGELSESGTHLNILSSKCLNCD